MLIRHKAEHDPLTDLLNRGSFEKLLKLHEEGEAPFALIIVDVDCFKSVNDTCGHAAGDKTLKKVAGTAAHGVPQHRLCVPYRRRRVCDHHGGDDQRSGIHHSGEN